MSDVGTVAWIEQLRPELRAVGLVGRGVGALAEERGYICYISSGIRLSFQRFAPFLEPVNCTCGRCAG